MGVKLFLTKHTHTVCRLVWIWLPDKGVRKVESLGLGVTPDKWGDVDPSGESSNSRRIPRGTSAKAVLGSWCYTRRNGQRCSKRKATQFQGIPSGVTLGTNSPEGSGGDPGVTGLYQEDWGSGDPSGRRLDSREFPAVWRSAQVPQKAAATWVIPVAARGDGVNGNPSSIPG